VHVDNNTTDFLDWTMYGNVTMRLRDRQDNREIHGDRPDIPRVFDTYEPRLVQFTRTDGFVVRATIVLACLRGLFTEKCQKALRLQAWDEWFPMILHDSARYAIVRIWRHRREH